MSKCLNQIQVQVSTVFQTYIKNRTVVEVIDTMNNKLNAHNARWQAHKNLM